MARCSSRSIEAVEVATTYHPPRGVGLAERRTVDLTPRLVAALGDWQAAIEADALARGIEPSPWVFPADSGELLDVKPVSRRFRALLRRAKLPRHRLYDLRHTYATHLLAEGAPITYVAAQLGHARPTTTLAHYAHWLPRGDRQWVERLDRARGSALGTRSWHQRGREGTGAADVPERNGEPWWDRTTDPLIKSQVLYQLS
jgi:integrase